MSYINGEGSPLATRQKDKIPNWWKTIEYKAAGAVPTRAPGTEFAPGFSRLSVPASHYPQRVEAAWQATPQFSGGA